MSIGEPKRSRSLNLFETDSDESSEFRPRVQFIIVFVAALFASYVIVAPLTFSLPGRRLDPSWIMVLGEASGRGLHFGTDIIFTGGPLSALYTHYLPSDSAVGLLALRLFITVAFALLIARLARLKASGVFIGLVMVALLLLSHSRDAIFIAFPMLTGLLALSSSAIRAEVIALAAGVSAAAIVSLARFSVVPVAVLTFIVADAIWLLQRRLPVLTASYITILIGLFALLEPINGFIPFIRGSLSTSAGYTDAMFIAGPRAEIMAFIGVAAVVLVAALDAALSGIREKQSSPSAAAARWLIIALYLFMVWKAGFVRHDLQHSLTAWSGLVIGAIAYAFVARRNAAVLITIAVAISLSAIPTIVLGARPYSAFLDSARTIISTRASELSRFVANPYDYMRSWRVAKDAALARIRKLQPLSHFDGSVDVIPSIQSSVIANNLDYRPRPTIQEYTSYTGYLIERNRRYIIESGPKFILMQPGSIDGRHPAMAEGPLWPNLLSLYAPYRYFDSIIALRRREKGVDHLFGQAQEFHGQLGKAVVLPNDADAVFLSMKIRKTLLGHLASVLYRPSALSLIVRYMDGSGMSFRLVPKIAEAGFIVSPYIENAMDFLLLASGDSDGLRKAKEIEIVTSSNGQWQYHREISGLIRPLDLGALRKQQGSKAPLSSSEEDLLVLMRAPQVSGGRRSIIGEARGAHAPMDIELTLPRAGNAISISYGIGDGAWKPADGTDGVCFLISRRNTSGADDTMLLENCLQPKTKPEDRGKHVKRIDGEFRQGDVIKLSTRCRGDCRYDWSYWTDFSLR